MTLQYVPVFYVNRSFGINIAGVCPKNTMLTFIIITDTNDDKNQENCQDLERNPF